MVTLRPISKAEVEGIPDSSMNHWCGWASVTPGSDMASLTGGVVSTLEITAEIRHLLIKLCHLLWTGLQTSYLVWEVPDIKCNKKYLSVKIGMRFKWDNVNNL